MNDTSYKHFTAAIHLLFLSNGLNELVVVWWLLNDLLDLLISATGHFTDRVLDSGAWSSTLGSRAPPCLICSVY